FPQKKDVAVMLLLLFLLLPEWELMAAPRIRTPGHTYVKVKAGGKVRFDCEPVGNPPPQITWIMPDNIFITAPYFGSRINIHENGTLEIRNVRPTDTAEFICMARNDGGEAVMVVQLQVTSMLRRPIFKNPLNERVVTRLGKTTVLNCSADGQPVPEITWLLPDGTRVTGTSRGAQYQLGNDGVFILYSATKEDAGKYRCAAKNSVGYIEKLIVLEVGQKPYILTRPKGIIRSMSGEPLYLHCLADGSPQIPTYIIPLRHNVFTIVVSLNKYLIEQKCLGALLKPRSTAGPVRRPPWGGEPEDMSCTLLSTTYRSRSEREREKSRRSGLPGAQFHGVWRERNMST
uniref:Immunoglobulin superfamily member 10 n=1 Tax=Scleropages formosus TaxID=113540 RepID=A0A8D0CJ46_SCLFO